MKIMQIFNKSTFVASVLLATLLFSNLIYANTIEAYGTLPTNRSLNISPDGEKVAWLQELDNDITLIVAQSSTLKPIKVLALGEGAIIRSVYFITDRFVILEFSKARKLTFAGDRYEDSAAYSLDLETGNTSILLRNSKGIHFAQTNLGEIIGLDEQNQRVLMPAYDNTSDTNYNLYSVDLATGIGKRYKKGNNDTIEWHVNAQGKVIAREDFIGKKDQYRVYAYNNDEKARLIYESTTNLPDLDIVALDESKNALIVFNYTDTKEFLSELSLETGDINTNLFSIQENNITNYIKGHNDQLFGISISGLKPRYHFFDEKINHALARLLSTFDEHSVELLSHSKNFNKALVRVSGSQSPGKLYLFDTNNIKLIGLGKQFTLIDDQSVADVSSFDYQSRDGLGLNAVITWPLNSDKNKRMQLPTLIFPHGGPESYDAVRFDWWAQYFASQGYLVVQPNFRGSTGFGVALTQAGYGKWGKEMQDDITDALDFLIDEGIADKNRVCIMGASYGGYAALAGGAFTPEKYRCVISVNGVSDVPQMIRTDKSYYGKNSTTAKYWEQTIKNETLKNSHLEDISPINFSKNFQAPTLLIASKNDTIVPPRQSKNMARALKKSKNPVKLVLLKGEDHWLSKSQTRLDMLREIDKFLKEHNPIQ